MAFSLSLHRNSHIFNTVVSLHISKALRIAKDVGHSFNGEFVVGDVHDGNARDFAYPPLQVAIARAHNVTLSNSSYSQIEYEIANLVLGHSIDQAIVCVGSFVLAR